MAIRLEKPPRRGRKPKIPRFEYTLAELAKIIGRHKMTIQNWITNNDPVLLDVMIEEVETSTIGSGKFYLLHITQEQLDRIKEVAKKRGRGKRGRGRKNLEQMRLSPAIWRRNRYKVPRNYRVARIRESYKNTGTGKKK